MEGKFVIVKNLTFNEYMSDKNGCCMYDTYEDAYLVCSMYEFPSALILEIKKEYKEIKNT